MSSLGITIDVRDQVSPLLSRIENLDMGRMNQAVAAAEENLVRDHLTQVALNRHATAERLGARPTGFWEMGAGATESGIASGGDASGATVSITHPGISRVAHPVTILPGPGKKALAIPIHALSYGKKASELRDFSGIETFIPKGTDFIAMKAPGDGKGIIPLYLLRPSVTLPQDRTLLPSDEQLAGTAILAIAEFLETEAAGGGQQ